MRNNSKPNREGQVGIRLTSEERALLEAAAKADRRTLSDWARLVLLRAARRPKRAVA